MASALNSDAKNATITTNNGKVFTGIVIREDPNSYLLFTGGSHLTIYKHIIANAVFSEGDSLLAPVKDSSFSNQQQNLVPSVSTAPDSPSIQSPDLPNDNNENNSLAYTKADCILLPFEGSTLDQAILDSLQKSYISKIGVIAPTYQIVLRNDNNFSNVARLGLRVTLNKVDQWICSITMFDFSTSAVEFTRNYQAMSPSEAVSFAADGFVKDYLESTKTVSEAVLKEQAVNITTAAALEGRNVDSTTVSVLPATSADIASDIIDVLTADLRQGLGETDAFSVMARDEMEEILKEQAFQLSGACDELTCAVQAGQVIGVSRIVATKLSRTGKNKFAASVSLIDVTTGSIVITASEERSGEMYPTLKRILTNCATVLANKPNSDHQTYIIEQEKALQRKKEFEKRKEKRLSIAIAGGCGYPVFIASEDPDEKLRKYYNKALPTLKDINITEPGYTISPKSLTPDVSLRLGLKLGRKMVVSVLADYQHANWEHNELSLHFTSDIQDTVGSRVDHRFGPTEKKSYEYNSWNNISGGIGLRVPFLESRVVNAGVALGGQYVHGVYQVKYYENRIDNWVWESSYSEGPFIPQGMLRDNILVDTYVKLRGNGFGGRVSGFFEWNLSPSVGLNLEAELFSNFIYGYKGKMTVNSQMISATYIVPEKVTTASDDYKVEMLEYSNEYGDKTSGIFRTDQKHPADAKPFFKEFSTIRLSLAVTMYF
ncbi:MAG: hypothetical protein GX556_07325 [Fibrobacter sp.]|nr:hypothetical protein [Fibrobacter sp.]